MSVDLDSWSILRKLTVYVASKKKFKYKEKRRSNLEPEKEKVH